MNKIQSQNEDSAGSTILDEQSTFVFPYKSLQFSFLELVFGGSWLLLSSNWLVLVQLHEFGKIELGLLEDLDLSDHAVFLEWEDLGAFFLNLFANVLFDAI